MLRRLYRLRATNLRRVRKVVYKQATIYEASSNAKLMLKIFSLHSSRSKRTREDLKPRVRRVGWFWLVGPTSLYGLSWFTDGNFASYRTFIYKDKYRVKSFFLQCSECGRFQSSCCCPIKVLILCVIIQVLLPNIVLLCLRDSKALPTPAAQREHRRRMRQSLASRAPRGREANVWETIRDSQSYWVFRVYKERDIAATLPESMIWSRSLHKRDIAVLVRVSQPP